MSPFVIYDMSDQMWGERGDVDEQGAHTAIKNMPSTSRTLIASNRYATHILKKYRKASFCRVTHKRSLAQRMSDAMRVLAWFLIHAARKWGRD